MIVYDTTMQWKIDNRAILVFFFILSFFAVFPVHYASANTPEIQGLEQQIKAKEAEIEKLEQQIAAYQKELVTTKTEGTTLKKTIDAINKQIVALKNSIKLTQTKIDKKRLEISKLSGAINEKIAEIRGIKNSIGEIIAAISRKSSESFLYTFLSQLRLSAAFAYSTQLASLDVELKNAHDDLEDRKSELEGLKGKAETQKKDLEKLQSTYTDQKSIQEDVQKEKSDLLKKVQSKESEYQKLLKSTEEKKLAIEREIDEAEEKLRRLINPALLPKARAGVLLWPMDGGRLSQGYGVTPFSSRSPIYNHSSGFHNGIDIGAQIGTEVLAAESGVVLGVGNNDLYCKGLAYGGWLLIKHNNNLTTLYAHLSQVRVSPGTEVQRGDHVAYSGNTGRSTGPHMHFTVYDSNTVQIFPSQSCGPIPRGGSLNPLDYIAIP